MPNYGQWTRPYAGNRDLIVKNSITLTDTTETTLIAAGGAGIFHDLVQLVITNTSATAVRIDLRDTTGGSVIASFAVAANGGAVIPFIGTLPQTAVNTNWTAQLSANITDIRILAIVFKTIAS